MIDFTKRWQLWPSEGYPKAIEDENGLKIIEFLDDHPDDLAIGEHIVKLHNDSL